LKPHMQPNHNLSIVQVNGCALSFTDGLLFNGLGL
jgi:hypothetical protein